jgi:hypothetical protein
VTGVPATAITPTAGHLDVGDTWLLAIEIREDLEPCDLVDADVTVQVTLPDTSTAAPLAVREDLGQYVASYVLTQAGRHTATLTVSGDVTSVETFAVDAEVPSGLPNLAAVQEYLGATSASAEQIQDALDAETVAQAKVCRIPAVYDDDLAQALKRRVARNLFLRGMPVAVLRGDGEVGDTVIPGRDPEVRRYEAPHRKLIVG